MTPRIDRCKLYMRDNVMIASTAAHVRQHDSLRQSASIMHGLGILPITHIKTGEAVLQTYSTGHWPASLNKDVNLCILSMTAQERQLAARWRGD